MQTEAGIGLEADAVRPAQFYPPPSLSPEKRLMLAILEDALRILRKSPRVVGRRDRGLFSETEEWFFSDETGRSPLSFLDVCEALDIDPVGLRAQLRRPTTTGQPSRGRHVLH